MSKKAEQGYIILKNLNLTPLSIADHCGSTRTLSPLGKSGDTIKVVIGEAEQKDFIVRKYRGIAKTPRLLVKISEGLDKEFPAEAPKSSVVSNINAPKDIEARVKFMRENVEVQVKQDRINKARLIRAKVEKAIKLGTSTKKAEEDALKSLKKSPIIPEDINIAIEDLSDKEGAVITKEVLDAMTLPELQSLATTDLSLEIKATTKKNKLIKAVLEALKTNVVEDTKVAGTDTTV